MTRSQNKLMKGIFFELVQMNEAQLKDIYSSAHRITNPSIMHLSGNKYDNRPENLISINPKQNRKL